MTMQGHALKRLYDEVQALKARVNRAITLTGAIRLDPTPIGLLPIHTHQGTSGGGQLDHGLALTGLVPDDDHTQYVLRNILTTKGDIFVRTAAIIVREPVGADGEALLADSLQASGIDWGVPAPVAHDLLSAYHGDTLAAAVVDGDVAIGNVTPKWSRLAIAVPAANVRNVLGIDNAELRPSWKTALDGVNPADIAAAAAPGVSLVFSHRDHVHDHPAALGVDLHHNEDHAARHQNAGADEINVAGLSGLLADEQDAGWLKGRAIEAGAPGAGEYIAWNNVASEWQYVAPGAPGAHKDTHDPEDGADPLDTAAAGVIQPDDASAVGTAHSLARSDHVHQIDCDTPNAIAGVQAGAEGTAYEFARSDHDHAIAHSIADNALATIDGTINPPILTDYARFTALGLEGRSPAELRGDINVADGADVTGANPPQAHAASHENGGGDELSVVGLSGLLADPQTPISHAHAYHTDRTRNRWLPAAAWDKTAAAASIASVHGGRAVAWLLDDSSDEHIATMFVVPEDWASGTVTAKIYYTMAGVNTSDDVVLRLLVGSFGDGENMAAHDALTPDTVTVPDAADTLDIHTHSQTTTVAAGEVMQFRVQRTGADGADTAAGDLQFLGLELEYTADM